MTAFSKRSFSDFSFHSITIALLFHATDEHRDSFSVRVFIHFMYFACLAATPRFLPRVVFRARESFANVFDAPAARAYGYSRADFKVLPDSIAGTDVYARADDDARVDGTAVAVGDLRTYLGRCVSREARPEAASLANRE